MTSPETEASALLIRQVSKLHDEVVSSIRVLHNQLEGTFDGAIMSDIVHSFVNHNVPRAIGSATSLSDSELCTHIQSVMRNYLESLPKESSQIASTVYSVCVLNDVHALLMSCVPTHIINTIKLLNGGRFLLEKLEMTLVVVAKSLN